MQKNENVNGLKKLLNVLIKITNRVKIMNTDTKNKLWVLLEKASKCSFLYYIDEQLFRKESLMATNGDETPYKLIEDTFDYFYKIENQKIDGKTYFHEKCNMCFSVYTARKINEYHGKIKHFANHIYCLVNDKEYFEFLHQKGYL